MTFSLIIGFFQSFHFSNCMVLSTATHRRAAVAVATRRVTTTAKFREDAPRRAPTYQTHYLVIFTKNISIDSTDGILLRLLLTASQFKQISDDKPHVIALQMLIMTVKDAIFIALSNVCLKLEREPDTKWRL